MQYDMFADFLVGQWEDMMGWRRIGYQGLDYDACAPQWKTIMESLEVRTGGVGVFKAEDNTIFHAAARIYSVEGI
jgi:hypothetical protein